MYNLIIKTWQGVLINVDIISGAKYVKQTRIMFLKVEKFKSYCIKLQTNFSFKRKCILQILSQFC